MFVLPTPTRTSLNGLLSFFATSPRGLEPILAKEIDHLLQIAQPDTACNTVPGGVQFKCTWLQACRITFWSRIAGRIGLLLGSHSLDKTKTPEQNMVVLARRIPWAEWFSVAQTFRVDVHTVGFVEPKLRFIQLRLKDVICEHFMGQYQERPSVDTTNPDVRVFSALLPDRIDAYIDLAGDNLFKRGWRKDKGVAPIKENLAAGLWAITRQHGITQTLQQQGTLNCQDPFCGSGTLAIEALSVACDRANGLERHFAFENLTPHDARITETLLDSANERFNRGLDIVLNQKTMRWECSDITEMLVQVAQENAICAGFAELVDAKLLTFKQLDARHTQPFANAGLIVSNPPYGERARAKGATQDVAEDEAYLALFKDYGHLLKTQYAGWTAFLLSADPEFKTTIGLSPKNKSPIFNGDLECRWYVFPIASGAYRPRAQAADA